MILNLFPDARFEATIKRSRPVSREGIFVYAVLKEGGYATFFTNGGMVRGEVHSSNGVFAVRSDRASHMRIEQLKPAPLHPVDHGTYHREQNEALQDWHQRTTTVGQTALSSDGQAETVDYGPDETVDVLVAYTPAAEADEGGRAQIEMTIISDVENTNQALANSGLDHRQIRLVAMERIEHDLSEIDAAHALAYPKGLTDLDPTGVLDEVFELQHRYGADMVHLFAAGTYLIDNRGCGASAISTLFDKLRAQSICSSSSEREKTGIASEGCVATLEKHLWARTSYSHSAIYCASRIFTHELGHNFGLLHDRYAERAWLSLLGPIRFPVRPYGFGYVNQNFDHPACHRTLMAYPDQCIDNGKTNVVTELLFANADLELGSEENGFDPAGVTGNEWTVELDGPVDASRALDDTWDLAANLLSKTESGHDVPFLPAAEDDRRQGFVRVVNHSAVAGTVTIEAFDDGGQAYEPVSLTINADETVHFNSDDLELGTHEGLSAGVGEGAGDWRLKLTSPLEIEVLAYVRTPDGFLTSMHDLMPASGPGRRAAFFNPGSNENQVSLLRLVNDYHLEADVLVTATDDSGTKGGRVRVVIPPNAARTFTSKELEQGSSEFEGAFGDGTGKWRLSVESVWTDWHWYWNPPETLMRVMAMSLLESPTGHLANLSTVPRNDYEGTHRLPLFPAKSTAGRQGFARVVNRTNEAAEASILAYDDEGTRYGPVTLSLGAGKTVHFNSADLESGNPAKGLSGGIGSGKGEWRLELSSASKLEVLAYVRTDDGFVTTMHEAAPSQATSHRAAVFNPGSNVNQASSLRLVNPGDEDVEVTITGIDGNGESPGGEVRITIPPQASRMLTAHELEVGGSGLEGALGDGAGKWQLEIEAKRDIFAMSLLESATGHLTNLSTAPVRGVGPWPPRAREK